MLWILNWLECCLKVEVMVVVVVHLNWWDCWLMAEGMVAVVVHFELVGLLVEG